MSDFQYPRLLAPAALAFSMVWKRCLVPFPHYNIHPWRVGTARAPHSASKNASSDSRQ